jgi:small subunit ribosomal protein S3Ae
MASKKKTKVMDKWKQKKWFSVVTPAMFDNKSLCELVAAEDKHLVNRIVRTSLADIGVSGASSIAMFTSLKFRVNEVRGDTAYTKLIGHEVAPSYMKTFARRGRSLIHQVVDVKTKDGLDVRLKAIAVTGARVSENTKRNLREKMVAEIKAGASQFNYGELMQEILYGRFVSKLYNSLKKITKMKRTEIRKSELKEVFA